MSMPTLSLDVIKEYVMSTKDHSGEKLVICERMMQERALLSKFTAKEYFLQISRKDLEEVMELSLMI